MGLIVLVAFSAVVVRLWSLQVLHSSHYRNVALVYEAQTVPITPARGLILAREGKILVGDQVLPVVTLSRSAATPVVIGRLARSSARAWRTSTQLSTTPRRAPTSPYRSRSGSRSRPSSTCPSTRDLFPGVAVAFTAERTYPYGDTAAQVLGYTGDIDESE